MPHLKIYTLPIPAPSQDSLGSDERQQLATAGVLGEDGGSLEQVASDPGDQRIVGVYRGRHAGKMARELEELSRASGFGSLPVAGMDESTAVDGYYAIGRAQVEPHAPAATVDAQRYELELSKKGTRQSHYRAVETNPRQVEHNPWGNDFEATIGAPAEARKVQWYDAEDGTRSPATPIDTRDAEGGDVDVFDLDDGEKAVGVEAPTLLYEIDYTREERLDCRVYDTRGHASKFEALDDGRELVRWAKVFVTDHPPDDPLVLDNGLLRVWLDEGAGAIHVHEWDPDSVTETEGTGLYGDGLYGSGLYAGSQGGWVDTGIGDAQPADVSLFDVDVSLTSMARDRVQVTLDVDGDLLALDLTIATGADSVLVELPDGEPGPVPTDVVDWLEPVAATSIVDAQPAKTLVSRSSVRR